MIFLFTQKTYCHAGTIILNCFFCRPEIFEHISLQSCIDDQLATISNKEAFLLDFSEAFDSKFLVIFEGIQDIL